jgi:outer membrane protein assembly factor BamB
MEPSKVILLLPGLLLLAAGGAPADPVPLQAEGVLAAAGVHGGFCVHLGCGDGALGAELARAGNLLVQGLDADGAAVEAGRKKVLAAGLYGQVTLERFSGRDLPYADNLVNLVVVTKPLGMTEKEILRITAPGGAVYQDGKVKRKPRPPALGEWNHERCGADNNPVSKDEALLVPQGIRWLSSEKGRPFLTSGGRNFYGAGNVVARDAFNGLPIWKGSAKPKVAVDNRLYAISGNGLAALDAATGKVVRKFELSEPPLEVLHEKGTLFVFGGKGAYALDAEGKHLWAFGARSPGEPAVGEGRVFFLEGNPRRGEERSITALEAATGKKAWSVPAPKFSTMNLGSCVQAGTLIIESSALNDDGKGCTVYAFSAKDGRKVWEYPYIPSMAHQKTARVYFSQGLFWVGSQTGAVGLDPATGKETKRHNAIGRGHCYPPVATTRFYIHGELDFTDLQSGQRFYSRIQKGSCGIGFRPANGLLYTFPSHCICFPMLKGANALAPAPDQATMDLAKFGSKPLHFTVVPDARAIDRPSIGIAAVPSSSSMSAKPLLTPAKREGEEWPCYRHDAWRSGATPGKVPERLEKLWETKVAEWPAGPLAEEWKSNPRTDGPVTAPVAAAGLVIVALPEEHRVVALDADSGQLAWIFAADGRIDTPPTVAGGHVLFGTALGYVYSVSASRGQFEWRFRAAPREDRIISHGQVESPWPVPGSVLVDQGAAFVAAGRHPHADGGIFVYALEAASGAVRWVQQVEDLGMNQWYNRLATDFEHYDLMVKDGAFVSMSRWKFDPKTGAPAPDFKTDQYRGGRAGAWVPQGMWSYGEPMNRERARRPLTVFDDTAAYSGADGLSSRKLQTGDKAPAKGGSAWTARCGKVQAMLAAGPVVVAGGSGGEVWTFSAADGKAVQQDNLLGSSPVWDGMAAAWERVYVSTQNGKVVCLGRRK